MFCYNFDTRIDNLGINVTKTKLVKSNKLYK